MPWTPKSWERRMREARGSAADAVYHARRRADPTSTEGMVERWRRSHRWQSLRTRFLEVNPTCRHCTLSGFTTAARELDHVVPAMKAPHLFWTESNLQALCSRCHAAKSARERAGLPEPEALGGSAAPRATCDLCLVRTAVQGQTRCPLCMEDAGR